MTISFDGPRVLATLSAWRTTRSAASTWLLAATLLGASLPAWSVTCGVSATGVNFGSYDVFSNVNSDGAGSVSVSCDAAASYSIAISSGNGSYVSRWMASGAHQLAYNLYREASRSTIWGDGTGGSAVVSGSGTGATHTVYGRVPSRQNVYAGSYSDSIVVTVTY
ncbi:MAG: spore coat protein U [Betaproteobacteria bacterium HGW-Betaproteobacteria-7]|jgi:spore coat protein U-like protein|nr:MAG: spore coat protein U [Betaproteobacteria bacterium HGW-Betaproteobacteria-7]